MKNDKGFTLIELLAVILILGIIALIAIPTVSSVVEQARKGAANSSANSFIKTFEEKVYMMELSSDYLEDGDYLVSEILDLGLDIKGTVPDSGFITIKEHEVTNCQLLVNGYVINCGSSEEKKENVVDKIDTNSFTLAENSSYLGMVYYNPTEGKKCTKSDFDANLASYDNSLLDSNGNKSQTGLKDGCMIWYIYDDNGDGTVDMLLNHNTTALVVWNTSKTGTTPVTANNQLVSDTSNWKDTARLISIDEVAKIAGVDVTSETNYHKDETDHEDNSFFISGSFKTVSKKYHWLYDYTRDVASIAPPGFVNNAIMEVADNNKYNSNYQIDGYWTSSFGKGVNFPGYNYAWVVGYAYSSYKNANGTWSYGTSVYNDAVGVVSVTSPYSGIRPVITVNKSIFE